MVIYPCLRCCVVRDVITFQSIRCDSNEANEFAIFTRTINVRRKETEILWLCKKQRRRRVHCAGREEELCNETEINISPIAGVCVKAIHFYRKLCAHKPIPDAVCGQSDCRNKRRNCVKRHPIGRASGNCTSEVEVSCVFHFRKT